MFKAIEFYRMTPLWNNLPQSIFSHFLFLVFFHMEQGTCTLINRARTCTGTSMSDWAEHLMWYEDGRFAQNKYFKFILHNIIMRERSLEQSPYIMKLWQQIGDEHRYLDDLKWRIQRGDNSIAQKMLYFGAC